MQGLKLDASAEEMRVLSGRALEADLAPAAAGTREAASPEDVRRFAEALSGAGEGGSGAAPRESRAERGGLSASEAPSRPQGTQGAKPEREARGPSFPGSEANPEAETPAPSQAGAQSTVNAMTTSKELGGVASPIAGRGPDMPAGPETGFAREGLSGAPAAGAARAAAAGSSVPAGGVTGEEAGRALEKALAEKAFSEKAAAPQKARDPADAIFKDFSAFFGGAAAPAPQAAAAAAAAAPAAGIEGAEGASLPSDALQSVVSQILVNSPDAAESEVRLTISEDLLKGTEISLVRDKATGELMVRIECSDPSSLQTLVAAQHDLRTSLQAQEKSPVEVRVSSQDAGKEGGNPSEHRSRGRSDNPYEER